VIVEAPLGRVEVSLGFTTAEVWVGVGVTSIVELS
jgi:hypothetical protein